MEALYELLMHGSLDRRHIFQTFFLSNLEHVSVFCISKKYMLENSEWCQESSANPRCCKILSKSEMLKLPAIQEDVPAVEARLAEANSFKRHVVC